jgi:hypothetical protein
MSQAVTAEFVTLLTGQYVRNNKSAEQKNLRCFPSCGEGGHCRLGFCGTPIVVRCTVSNPANASFSELSYGTRTQIATSPNNFLCCLVAYGDFVIEGGGDDPVGHTVVVSTHNSRTRRDDAPANPLHKSTSVRKVQGGCGKHYLIP